MSERFRNTTALILLITSIILTALQLPGENGNSRRYMTAENNDFIPETIEIEKSGNVKINADDAEALELLPGIGPAYAERIVRERSTNGPFYYPEDLISVKGIGQQTLSSIRTMIDMTYNEGGN